MYKIKEATSGVTPRFIEQLEFEKFLVRFQIEEVDGVFEYLEFETNDVSLKTIHDVITNHYNSLCDKEILNGLSYQGSPVWLSDENQRNYSTAYILTFIAMTLGQELDFPVFKLGTDIEPVYITFEDFIEFSTFINLCFSHIKTTLNKYWEIKNNINIHNYTLNNEVA